MTAQPHDLIRSGRETVRRPSIHELAPLLEEVRPFVGPLHRAWTVCANAASATSPGVLVASATQSRKLDRKPCTVTPASMSRSTFSNVMSERGFPLRMPGKTRSLSAWRSRIARWNTSLTGADNGTTCGLPAFIRAAGIAQVAASRSSSPHEAPRISPDRVAVRSAASSASLPTLSRSRSLVRKAGTSVYGSAAWCRSPLRGWRGSPLLNERIGVEPQHPRPGAIVADDQHEAVPVEIAAGLASRLHRRCRKLAHARLRPILPHTLPHTCAGLERNVEKKARISATFCGETGPFRTL